MTSLIACLGGEKGTVSHVAEIVKQGEWDKVFLIAESKTDGLFDNVEFILINPNSFLSELIEDIKNKLNGKIADTEVALNIISGSGKQHMAVLSALLKLGVGIRLVALTKQGIKEV